MVSSRIMKMSDDDAAKSIELWKEYEGAQAPWNAQAWNNLDFALAKHWTESQKMTFYRRGQVPLEIDRISPIIEYKVAVATANKPIYEVIPMGFGSDEHLARIMRILLYHTWDYSYGGVQLADCIKMSAVTGRGCLLTREYPLGDNGMGEVVIENMSNPHEAFPDPNSRTRMYNDGEAWILTAVMNFDRALYLFPKYRKLLEEAKGQYVGESFEGTEDMHASADQMRLGDFDYSNTENRLRIIERYCKKIENYNAWFPSEKAPRLKPRLVLEGRETEEDFRNIQNGYYGESAQLKKSRCYRYVSAGDVPLFVERTPFEDYPIVPINYNFNGNPYPTGEVHRLKGLQKEIDKRRALLQYHAAVSAAMRILYQRGAINPKEWGSKGSVPGAMLPYNQGFNKPDFITPQTSSAIGTLGRLEESAKYDMEYAAGVWAQDLGFAGNAPRTLGQTEAYAEYGSRRMVSFMDQSVHPAIEQVGRLCIQLYPHVFDYEKVIRLSDLEGKPVQEVINSPTLQMFGLRAVEMIMNDITVGRYDVKVKSQSTMARNRWTILQHMKEMRQLGVVDNRELIKHDFHIEDKEGLLQRTDELNIANQNLAQMAEVIKGLKRQLSIQENETRRAKMAAEIAHFKYGLKTEEAKTGAQHSKVRQDMEDLLLDAEEDTRFLAQQRQKIELPTAGRERRVAKKEG